ncbi:hypothetical protein H2509_16145 [Stappia sp. F7233]|uniref:Uncharacterized protein n=1 Tax=Stappia albiluteola TaxID=2758565 RepID=A0A839AIB2_9HYPH|nr:hypothetical protein [Stappia albiluteola]MBA5778662.1 hypothetical protein [Stappia albiluteola]
MEFEKTRAFRIAAAITCLVLAAIFAAVTAYNHHEQASKTHVAISGGGFIYNYRIAEIRSGITAFVQTPTPNGTRLIASFENPSGGDPIVVRHEIVPYARSYSFETPALTGVEKDRPYKVTLTVMDKWSDTVIETHEKMLVTNVAPSVVPDKPLTVGPGYHRNPERLQPVHSN